MNYLPKSPPTTPDSVRDSLVGGDLLAAEQVGRDDLSDWMELMEAVEALCPVWPEREQAAAGGYLL